MLYLKLLEESFVRQLHDDECNFKGLFNCSSRFCIRAKSFKHILKHADDDQQFLEIAEGDRANPCTKVESTESPGNRQDENVDSMDDNASTTEPVPEATSHARAASSGQSSSCYVGKHRHSPSRSAEGSDQNFDEETKGFGESRRGRDQKRLKPNDDAKSDQVIERSAFSFHLMLSLNVQIYSYFSCHDAAEGYSGHGAGAAAATASTSAGGYDDNDGRWFPRSDPSREAAMLRKEMTDMVQARRLRLRAPTPTAAAAGHAGDGERERRRLYSKHHLEERTSCPKKYMQEFVYRKVARYPWGFS